MEPQAASRHTSDSFGNANGVKGSNVRCFSSSAGRGIKREMVDEQPMDAYTGKSHQSPRDNSGNNNGLVAMSTVCSQQVSHKLQGQLRFSPPETDVCAWLRDEPMDMSTGGFLQSGSGFSIGKSLSGGSGGTRSNLELGGGHFVMDGPNGSPGSNATGEVTDDGSQRKGLGSMSTSSLYAQLRATKIKESILLEGIQRLGGGQKGLRGVIKAIMFWLEAKNRHTLQSSEPCISHSELPSPRLDEFDQFPWSNLDCGSLVDACHGQAGQQRQQDLIGQNLDHVDSNNGHSSPAPADLSCLLNSTSSYRDSDANGSLRDLGTGDGGSGEYCGQVQSNYESQQPPVSAFIGMQAQVSGPGAAAGGGHRDISSGNWVPSMREYILRPEKSHPSRLIRKLSPSSDDSGIHSTHDLVASFDDALSQDRQQGKIRRHSPTAGYSTSRQSSSVSSEFPAYLSSPAPPVPEVLGAQAIFGAVGANPFAPGGAFNPTSPASADPPSMDFNAFGTQGSILVDEGLGLGGSVPGCGPIDSFGSIGCPLSPEQSLDKKPSGVRLGVVSKSKASPAACTRLARKQRMDRNRKAALYQVNRGASENNGLSAGKSCGSPGSLRSLCRSQGSPASDGPTCRIIDRRDQENLQFLLLKVLRPSDVGNLGRIVLPKKDAESHLPWLGAREGMQLTCEDYDTGEMMTLRYRFWPNNKSRMYLLENTGDFVKKHHLQESDRMLIYRNQKQGIYIIRARKAHDCVDGLPNLDHTEDVNEDTKEIIEQSSPGGPCSSGTSSLSGAESSLGSGHDGGSESRVPVPVIATSHDDLLNFADLPDAPMGEGTENLVRFPSLESFDVELLELASANKQEVTSCTGNIKE